MPWSITSPPARPGHYLNFKSLPQAVTLPNAGGVVAVPVVGDWGPFKTSVKCASLQDFINVFGSNWSPARIAVEQAFRGEGIPGYGGASQVIVYRFGGAAAAKGAVVLAGTGGTALTLTAKYEGSRANGFTITVQTNATDGTKKDIILYEGATILEQFTQVDASTNAALVALAALITSESGWVTAAAGVGTDITNVSGAAVVGGNDGLVITAGDWASVFDTMSSQDFATFAPFDLTDTSIQASLKAWVQDQNDNKGRRFSAVVGGAANELIAAALARTLAMQDENIETIGVGQFFDPNLNPVAGGTKLSTSQLAPRIAGILSARGIYRDMTYARLAGLQFDTSANSVPTDTDILQALSHGLLIVGSDGHPLSALRVEKGLTSYYQSTDPDKSVSVFGVPKFVMTMQEFERRLKLWSIVNVITPGLAITKDTREFVVGYAQQILNEWVNAGVLQPGALAQISNNPPPQPTDDFINIDYTWTFARSVQQVRGTAYVL